jgi:hypothetical protein
MGYNARNDEIRDNITRMRREWEAQRKAEHKQFNLDPKDISELYDVIFVGFPDPHRGQVGAYASAAGRAAIDKVLPNSVIKWRPLERNIKIFPDDWLEFHVCYGKCCGPSCAQAAAILAGASAAGRLQP